MFTLFLIIVMTFSYKSRGLFELYVSTGGGASPEYFIYLGCLFYGL